MLLARKFLFEFPARKAKDVCLAEDFNHWHANGNPMKDMKGLKLWLGTEYRKWGSGWSIWGMSYAKVKDHRKTRCCQVKLLWQWVVNAMILAFKPQ